MAYNIFNGPLRYRTNTAASSKIADMDLFLCLEGLSQRNNVAILLRQPLAVLKYSPPG